MEGVLAGCEKPAGFLRAEAAGGPEAGSNRLQGQPLALPSLPPFLPPSRPSSLFPFLISLINNLLNVYSVASGLEIKSKNRCSH